MTNETFQRIATAKDVQETRLKFYEAARQSFPNVGEPEVVWVLNEVLGWDLEKINRVSVSGFGKDGYRLFVLDTTGTRIVDAEKQSFVTVTRKWDKQEKRLLKDWWWLLGF